MPGGELQLNKEKNQIEINTQRNHEAEEVLNKPKDPYALDIQDYAPEKMQQKSKDAATNTNVGDEKKWVKEGLDKMVKKADEERAERERAAKENLEKQRQERALREEQKSRLDLFASDRIVLRSKRNVVSKTPAISVLSGEYGSKFKTGLSSKKLKKKQNNKRSRLYTKKQNFSRLNLVVKRIDETLYKRTKTNIGKYESDITNEDYRDLSRFFIKNNTYTNDELCKLFFGSMGEDGMYKVKGDNVRLALVRMAEMLVNFDLNNLDLSTDSNIVANAEKLETIAAQLAAFERMSEKYNFIDSLDPVVKEDLNGKLDRLRTVSAYYTVRKQLITDETYRDHYNYELSMDLSKANTVEQKAIAEKLIRSFWLGRNIMLQSGATEAQMRKLKLPKFKNGEADTRFIAEGNKYRTDNEEAYRKELIKLLKDEYAGEDQKAGLELMDLNEGFILDLDKDEQEEIKKEEGTDLLRESLTDFEDNDELVFEEKKKVKLKDKRKEKETGFGDLELNTLITSDELTPLHGTRQFAAIKNNIQAIQAMLSGNMPPVVVFDEEGNRDRVAEANAREETDGSCLAIVMLYNRLDSSLDDLLGKYKNAYVDLAKMLTEFRERCKAESESFREKTMEYRELVGNDPEMATKKFTWLDVLRFNRGVFYDLDNDKSITYKTDGAGASTVYVITRKVPITEENKKGEETVYFRKKDSVPSPDEDALFNEVMSHYSLVGKTKDFVDKSMRQLFKNSSRADLLKIIKTYKQRKKGPEALGREIASTVKNRKTGSLFDIPKEDYSELGKLLYELRDAVAKRCMAHDMKCSAKIDCGRNLSDRNVATSRTATLLGVQDMICDSRTATIMMDGKVIEGNLMENTGGVPTDENDFSYSSHAISQLFTLSVFDFICGQTDRHYGNFHGIMDGDQIMGIKCLDNDMAFGKIKPKHVQDLYNRLHPITANSILGLPVSVINRIMALEPAYLTQTLGDILNSEEIRYMADRLNSVKNAIKQVADDERDMIYDSKTNKVSFKGNLADEQLRQYKTLKSLRNTYGGQLHDYSKFYSPVVDNTDLDTLISIRKSQLEYEKRQEQEAKNKKKNKKK